MRRTIEKIIFRKESLEVVVSIIDKTSLSLDEGLAGRLGKRAHGVRGGADDPDAPACNTEFGTESFGETGIRTQGPVLPGQPLSRRFRSATPASLHTFLEHNLLN